MWVSKKRFEALEKRVRELEYKNIIRSKQSKYALFAGTSATNQEVIEMMMEHLGLELTKNEVKPITLQKKKKKSK